jgi:hypothetical protein
MTAAAAALRGLVGLPFLWLVLGYRCPTALPIGGASFSNRQTRTRAPSSPLAKTLPFGSIVGTFSRGGGWYAASPLYHHSQSSRTAWTTRTRSLLQASSNDEESSDDHDDDDEMKRLLRSLAHRQAELQQSTARKVTALRQAACTSSVGLVLPDWVRRIAVDYPLAVCGSASDVLYLAHLETSTVLASTATAMPNTASTMSSSIAQSRVDHVVHQLYGRFDGGGTLAVSLRGTVVVEARRSGGVHVWRVVTQTRSSDDSDTAGSSSTSSVQLVS